MKIRNAATIAAAAIAILAFTSCSSGTAAETGGGSSDKVVIKAAWVPTVHSTHWAVTNQFLEDESIQIELSPFKTNNEMMVAMQGNSIDMMPMGYNNTISALDRGDLNYKYVAGISEGGTRILVRNGVDIDSWEDVRGKTVGTAQGSTQYQQLVLAAQSHGIDIEQDTDFVNIGSAPDMVLALMNGDVDVVSIWEPSASEAIAREFGHEVPALSDTFYDDAWRVNSGLAVSNKFIEEHPEAVETVLAAFEKAKDKVNADKEFWVDEFMKLSSSDPEILKRAIENVSAVTAVDPGDVKAIAKSLHGIGIVNEDYSDRLDDYFVGGGNQ